jgi:amidase
MLYRYIVATLVAWVMTAGAVAAEPTGWAGPWNVTAAFKSGRSAAAMILSAEGTGVSGTSGPLDEGGFFPLTVRGEIKAGFVDLELLADGEVAGNLRLAAKDGKLVGAGRLYGVPVRIEAIRPPAARPPRTHDFKPDSYEIQYSARAEPVLTIASGDTVRTSTLDNEGRDAAGVWRGMPGNTLTGPFRIEGAMPGDTLAVRLVKVELSRDTAHMYSGTLNDKAVQPRHRQAPAKDWGRTWTLDREKGVARLQRPGERLGGLELPLKPMIGSIGVAAPLNQAIFAGDLGFHGGNLDYPRMTAGATVYLPVFQAGAMLFLGDGHALQGDGEITGQGLETSLDIEFQVELIKDKSLGQVWSEDAEFVMVSGIDNTLEAALQMATSGLARWLKERHGLNDSEVAALLGAAVSYDIAEIVDPRPHVVARISKRTLAMLKTAP